MSRGGNCHDNDVAESFFHLLTHKRIKKKIYGKREEARCDVLITLKYFITVDVGMIQVIRCHRLNMKSSIINSSKASRLSVAIQTGENKKHCYGFSIAMFKLKNNMDKINHIFR